MNTPFNNDPFSLVYMAFENCYPGKQCEVYWDDKDMREENGEQQYGFTEFNDDGSVVVCVSPDIKVADAVEILAHELAHVAVGIDENHGQAWERAFDRIFVEYNRIANEMFAY